MLKDDWKKALKEMEKMLKTATENVEAALIQKEELEFNVSNYKSKIETFK